MGDTLNVSFAHLEVKVGQTVQIVPDPANKKELFESTYIGAILGEALILTAPKSGTFSSLKEGQNLAIRILMPDGIAIFSAVVLYMTDIPSFMVYLDIPDTVKYHKIRKAQRVNISMPIFVSGTSENSSRNIDGTIVDISTHGAGLRVKGSAGEVDDVIVVRGKFNVGSIQRLLSFQALIITQTALEDDVNNYGVEFLEDNEDDLLVLFGFIFNALAFGEIQHLH